MKRRTAKALRELKRLEGLRVSEFLERVERTNYGKEVVTLRGIRFEGGPTLLFNVNVPEHEDGYIVLYQLVGGDAP